jgi:hypothetical protein
MFKRRGPDIDYTMLAKRGLIKKGPEPSFKKTEVTKDGYVKLGESDIDSLIGGSKDTKQESSNSLSSFETSQVEQSSQNPTGGLAGFFGDMNSFSTANNTSGNGSSFNNKDYEHLKVKFEDLEYKFDRLMEKIDFLESKIKSLGLE